MKTLSILLFILPALSWGQKNLDFLSSAELIEKGLELYEKENYYESIQEYRKVSINDTNYATAQYEIALSYMGMEEYKSAQNTLKELLEFDIRFNFKHQVYSLLGSAYDDNKETDKAIETYTEGIRLFPMQHNLYYNRGLTYDRLKEYDKALADYKSAIQCNFYHASSHLRLGITAANEGMYTQATLSLMTFLILEPTDSRAVSTIQLLESIADGTYEEEPKGLALSPNGDEFEELNLFYKNKIALQKNYKVKFTIPLSYGRQMHLILKNTKYDKQNLEFWNQHYLSFYQTVWDAKKIDPLIMLTLINLDNDNIQSKLAPKKKQIIAFIDWAGSNLRTAISTQYMDFEGEKQFVNAEYESKYFSGYGKTKEDGTPIGNFYYYHPNGSKRLNAHFDNTGKASGTWEIFNMYNGNIERKIEFTTQEDKMQYEYYYSGEIYQKYHLVNGYTEDTVYTYYRNGTLKEVYAVTKGLKDGPYKSYYPNGTLEYDIQYKADEVEGKFIAYHLNGQKSKEFTVSEDKVVGKRLEYYPNGQLLSDYSYENGLYNGAYTEYFADGKTSEKGTYKAGKSVGEMNDYFQNGQLSTTVVLDETGKQNGNSVYYDLDGKKYHEMTYSKGELTKIVFIDKKGNSSEVASKKGKKIEYVLNYPSGTAQIRGQYLNDERDGKWNYYDYYGNLERVQTFKGGTIVDTVFTYYSNGQLKSVSEFKEGQRNGIYLEYNIFGELTDEGFYKNGEYDRDWYSYFSDGSIQYENYFVEGIKNGIQKTYAVNGKLVSWEEYDLGRIIAHVFLDTNEQIVAELGEYNGAIELKNPDNSYVNFRGEYKNGNADGNFNWYGPNKNVEATGNYTNSERSGEWKWYHDSGKLEQTSTFVNGEKQGEQKSYYANGKLNSVHSYINDQLQGPYKNYFENGGIKNEGNFLNDNRQGKVTYYSPQGSVAMIRNYEQDVIVSYSYLDKEGKEVTAIPLDKQELRFVTYYKNGKKANEHSRKSGLVEGTYLAYHDNGQKWEEEVYLHGEAHGKFYEYSESGQKILEENYQFGQLHGKATYFYANGKLKTEKNYLFGQLHGTVTEYAADGKKTSITLYYNNEIVSIQKF